MAVSHSNSLINSTNIFFLVILFILVVYFIVVLRKTNKQRECLSFSSLSNEIPQRCPILKTAYRPLVNVYKNMDRSTFNSNSSENTNHKGLRTMCNIGNSILNNCDNYNIFTDPTRDYGFRTLCCNVEPITDVGKSIPISQCASGVDCVINKANLKYDSDTYSKLTDNSIPTYASQIKDYCSNGKSIIDNKCFVDDLHPLKDSTFKKLCCTDIDTANAGDLSSCGPDAVKCTASKSSFTTQSSYFQDFTQSSVTNPSNATLIRNFCKMGVNLSGCGGFDVNTSSSFVKYCCNKNSCTESNVDNCIVPAEIFKSYDASFQNETMIIANPDLFNSYCSLGNGLKNSGCTIDVDSYKWYKYCSMS